MKKHLSEMDSALESYLGRMANESLETRTRQAESVRIHYQTPAAGLALPAGQAAATGAFIGLAILALAYLAGWPKPWAWGLITWLGIQALVWLWLLLDWRRIVTHRLEEITRRDLDGDQVIGSPITSKVRVELVEDGGRTVKFIDLPGDPGSLSILARGLVNGTTLSESNWTGAGRPFTRSQYSELRAELIRRGLAAWNSPGTPARGATLTPAGRAVMRRLAEQPPSPSGEDDGEY